MQIQRPPLPLRLKIVAILLILGGFYALSAVLNRWIDVLAVILGIECVCGIGILRNNAIARRVAVTLLWIVLILAGVFVAWYWSRGGMNYFRFVYRVSSIVAYVELIVFLVLPFWMLRVLLDRRMDPLFDPRQWLIKRSDVFD